MDDDIQEWETLYQQIPTRREYAVSLIGRRIRLRSAIEAMERAASKGELAQEVHVQLSQLKLRLEEMEAELEGVKAEQADFEASVKAILDQLVAEHFPAEHHARARELLLERAGLPFALLDRALLELMDQARVIRRKTIDQELLRLNAGQPCNTD